MSYIPKNDKAFIAWVRKVIAYAALHFERFKVGAPTAELIAMIDDFGMKLDKIDNPNHGKVDMIEKNDARKTLEKAIRTYVQGFLAKNPNVTNADRESMGLPIYDTTPSKCSYA